MSDNAPNKYAYPNSATDTIDIIGAWYFEHLETLEVDPVENDIVCDAAGNPIGVLCEGCLVDPVAALCKTISLCGHDDADLCAGEGLGGCDNDCQTYAGEAVRFCLPSKPFDSGKIKFEEIKACDRLPEHAKAGESGPSEPRLFETPIRYVSGFATSDATELPAGNYRYFVCRKIGTKTRIGPSGLTNILESPTNV